MHRTLSTLTLAVLALLALALTACSPTNACYGCVIEHDYTVAFASGYGGGPVNACLTIRSASDVTGTSLSGEGQVWQPSDTPDVYLYDDVRVTGRAHANGSADLTLTGATFGSLDAYVSDWAPSIMRDITWTFSPAGYDYVSDRGTATAWRAPAGTNTFRLVPAAIVIKPAC